MRVIVQFDYARWIARYPEFAQVQQPTALEYFGEATLYLRNDGTGPVRDAETQLRLLNMLTAHIAALNAPSADGHRSGPERHANGVCRKIRILVDSSHRELMASSHLLSDVKSLLVSALGLEPRTP
jgi:Protein of unknown function (DUF4054)